MPENLKKLHTSLSEQNKDFNVPYEQFEIDMQNEDNLKKLHGSLVDRNGFNVPYEQFKVDMQVKKKDDTQTTEDSSAVSSSVSPEKEQASTLIEQSEGYTPPEISLQELHDTEKGVDKEIPKEEPTPKEQMEQVVSDVRGEDISNIIKHAVSGITDPRERKVTEGVVGMVEGQYKRGGTLSPSMKLIEFGKVIEPIRDAYLEALGGEYPTEEERGAHLVQLREIGNTLGLDVDDSGNPVLDKTENEWYQRSLERAYKKVEEDLPASDGNSFTKDAVTQVAKGSANLYANTLDLMGWSLAFNAIPGYEDLAEGQRYREEQFAEQVSRKDMDIVNAVQEGEYGKALGNTVLQFSESVPMLIALAMGNASGYGNAALGYMGAATGTGRYNELEDSEMSEVAKIANSVLYGAAEFIPEKYGTMAVLDMAKGAIKRGVKREVVESIIKEGYYSQAHKYTAMLAGGMNTAVRGGLDEAATSITQNILDGRDPYEGVGDAFIVGMFTDVLMASPIAAVTTVEEARKIAESINTKLPKNMPVDDKVKAGQALIEKEVVEREQANLDPVFQETSSDKTKVLDSSLKLTAQPQATKENVSEINKTINEELAKENPDVDLIVELNTQLDAVDKTIGVDKLDHVKPINERIGELVAQKETVEDSGSVDSEITHMVSEKQRARSEVYTSPLEGIDSDYNQSENKELKQSAKENIENTKKTLTEEKKAEVEQEGVKEEKVPQKEPKTEKKENVEPKLKEDEKEVQQKEGDSKKGTKEEDGKRQKEEVLEKVTLGTEASKKSGKMTAEALGTTVETKAISVDGKKVGFVEAGIFDKDIRMNNIRIEDADVKGKGVGKQTYKNLNEEAKQRGGVLVSSETISTEAENVWKSLVKEGVAEKVGDVYKFKKDAKEQQGGEMRQEGESQQVEEISDKDLPKVDRTELQDGKKIQEEIVPPKEPIEPESEKVGEKPEMREHKLGKRAIENKKMARRLTDELEMKGISYKVKPNKVSIAEANDITDAFIEEGRGDELAGYIKNPNSNIEPDVRTSMAVRFYRDSMKKAEDAATVAERNKYEKAALDIFEASQSQGYTSGKGVQSMTMWSDEIGSNPDLLVASTVKKQRETNDEIMVNREGDIKTASDIINSKEFKDLLDKKLKEQREKILKDQKAAKDKIKSGKAKMGDAMSRMASLKGVKKNAINENELGDNEFKILVDFADGALDFGIGSTQALITKIKIAFRPYLSPTDIDSVSERIIKETRANNRLKKRPKKRDVLTKKELDKVVDDLYNKMAGSTKAQVRKLVRDSVDRLVEGGALDEKSFRDLFASSIGLKVLDAETEAQLRSVAERLNDLRNMSDNLKKMFKDLIDLEREIVLAKKKGVETSGMDKKVRKTRKEVDVQIKEYNKSVEAARKANTEVSDFFADDKMTIDLLTTFIQGNLLTPASLLTNIAANVSWMPFRGASYSVGAMTDSMLSKVGEGVDVLQKYNKNPWIRRRLNSLPSSQKVYDFMGYSRGYVAGFKEGTVEGLVQMVKGQTSDDAFVREVSKAMHPFKAMMHNWDMLSGKERIKLGKFINNSLEATLGVAPEVVFRLLNLGDKPFRRAAEKARLSEIAALKGLEGTAREDFMLFPDPESAEDSRQHGLKSTYQQNTAISDLVLGLSKKQKDDLDAMDKFWYGVRKLITTLTIPFVKTPTNVVGEMIEYGVPGVALGKMVNHMVKGNRREATEYFAKAVIGASLDVAIYSLIAAGIFTLAPAGLEEEEEGKAKVKESEYRNKEAWMFNVDAFERYLNGGSTEFKPKDRLRSIKRFGVISALVMGKLEAIRGTAPDDLFQGDTASENVKEYLSKATMSFVPSMQAALDQSFLSGINTAATALVKGGAERDRWLVNMTKALSASAIPNTYAAINQYRDGYIRETKDRTLKGLDKNVKEIENAFRASYFADNGLPTKVTVWGEPVKRVPDGEGLGWILFDITRKKGYGSDFGVKIHELYERTGDSSILPSQPSQNYKFDGERIKLSQDLYEKLQITTGTFRKMVVEPLVNSYDWDVMTDDERIDELEKEYKKYNAKLPSIKRDFEDENWDALMKLKEKQSK